MNKRTIIAAVFVTSIILVAAIFLNIKARSVFNPGERAILYERATVVSIVNSELYWDEKLKLYRGQQDLLVKIKSGKYKGETMSARNSMAPLYNVLIEENSDIIVSIRQNTAEIQTDVYSYYRAPFYTVVLIVFFGILFLIGGKKGIMSAVSLIFTFMSIIFLFLPLIFIGFSPVLAAIIISILVSFVTLALLNGVSGKTLSAIIGTGVGLLVAGGTAFLTGFFANITIYTTQEAEDIVFLAQDLPINARGLLFAGVIIAALGAVMDVAISIAAAVYEIAAIDKKADWKKLFLSGINVCRDIIGTMSNTLILAFAGSSLSLIVLLYAYNMPIHQLINSNILGVEILMSVSGTLGVLMAAPITAYVSAWFAKKKF